MGLAAGHKIGGWTPLDPGSVDSLRKSLAKGQLMVLAAPVYCYCSCGPVRFGGDVRLAAAFAYFAQVIAKALQGVFASPTP